MAHVRYPSSMGVSFSVDLTISDSIMVEVEAARYVSDAPAEGRRTRTSSVAVERWRRRSLPIEPHCIKVSEAGQQSIRVADNLELFVRVRPANAKGVAAVTLALLNLSVAQDNSSDRDETAFFQPRITVRPVAESSPFVERPPLGSADTDEEAGAYRLLYRHAPSFATGHGCAVEWEPSKVAVNELAGVPAPRWVRTTFVPTYDLRLADSNLEIDVARLGMHRLATVSDAEVIAALKGFTSGYRAWIRQRRNQVDDIADKSLRETALEHLRRCTTSCDRMDAGIEILADPADPAPMESVPTCEPFHGTAACSYGMAEILGPRCV